MDRRRAALTVLGGGAALGGAALVAVPAAGLVAAPASLPPRSTAHTGRDGWSRVAQWEAVRTGVPLLVAVRGDEVDAWAVTADRRLGSVWLLRSGEGSRDAARAQRRVPPRGLPDRAQPRRLSLPLPRHALRPDGRLRLRRRAPRDGPARRTRRRRRRVGALPSFPSGHRRPRPPGVAVANPLQELGRSAYGPRERPGARGRCHAARRPPLAPRRRRRAARAAGRARRHGRGADDRLRAGRTHRVVERLLPARHAALGPRRAGYALLRGARPRGDDRAAPRRDGPRRGAPSSAGAHLVARPRPRRRDAGLLRHGHPPGLGSARLLVVAGGDRHRRQPAAGRPVGAAPGDGRRAIRRHHPHALLHAARHSAPGHRDGAAPRAPRARAQARARHARRRRAPRCGTAQRRRAATSR
jgi:hypothetical protein